MTVELRDFGFGEKRFCIHQPVRGCSDAENLFGPFALVRDTKHQVLGKA